MISYTQIQRIASEKSLMEETIEKDYLIELILFYLAKENYFKKTLIFRGGTALKKIYFSDYRFSEDIDFLIKEKESLNECEKFMDQTLANVSLEYPIQLNKRSQSNKDRLQLFIIYDIIPEIKTTKELKIDILKDSLIPAFHEKEILFQHEDFKKENISIKTYLLESVASDKIARILDVVNEPRDLYDLLHLLRLEIDVAKIKKELKKRFGYSTYLPNLLNEINKDEYLKNWELKLSNQVVNLPNFEVVVNELDELIKEKLLQ